MCVCVHVRDRRAERGKTGNAEEVLKVARLRGEKKKTLKLLKFYDDLERGCKVKTRSVIIKVVKHHRGHHRKPQLVGQSHSSALLCLSLPGTCLLLFLLLLQPALLEIK